MAPASESPDSVPAPNPETAPAETAAPRESLAEETGVDTAVPEPAPAPAPPVEEEAPPASPALEGDADGGEADPAIAESDAPDPITELMAEAQRRRLPPADEEKFVRMVVETLQGGREGLARALKHLPRMPWMLAVNSVSAAWPEMKPTLRNRLLAGLAREDSEAARRTRLSLARGLYKLDVPAALKIAAGVAKDLRDKETSAVTHKDAQIFTNVLIGRAKPWLVHLPLADLRPAEADVLVHSALVSVFQLPHSPATQLGVLKWAGEAGRLGKLHPHVAALMLKAFERWNARWRSVLKKDVPSLPAELEPPARPAPPERSPAPERGRRRELADADGPAEEEEPTVAAEQGSYDEPSPHSEEERAQRAEYQAHDDERRQDDEAAREETVERSEVEADEEDEDDEEREEAAEDRQVAKPYVKPRTVYESKTMPNGGGGQAHQQPMLQPQQANRRGGNFNLQESLRHIEQHVQGLRQELAQTQNKLRQREDDLRKNQRRPERTPAAPVIAGEPTPDELARLNVQLETRNQELQAQINELREDSETRAASADAVGSETPDACAQLRTLLAMKLEEDFADFHALEEEAADRVVQQHYRTVLRHVFEVLLAEGVALQVKPQAEHQSMQSPVAQGA